MRPEGRTDGPAGSSMPAVLMVDDDRGIALGGTLRLKAAGYAVRTAHDGLAALEEVRADVPDVMVLDLRMPRMDGFQVLAELNRMNRIPELPVVILSANVTEQARGRALALGARYFLEKPYDGQTLVEAVRHALAGEPSDTTGSA